jgi:2-oxoglutarate ferredoxin oxidoreductase subunit beta
MSYLDYLNKERIPHNWCAGCGHGLPLSAIARACEDLRLDKNKAVTVSGIGCWSRADGFLDLNSLHTTHGRPIAFATGVKIAKPELTVLVTAGDGDCVTIGGNHFIHAARRNVDITVIISNNYIYGTTGGQYSSTTPTGSKTATSILGHIERPLDVCALAGAAGATYVARSVCDNVLQNAKLISDGVRHKGFSLIEFLSPCPTHYGRKNGLMRMSDGLKFLHDCTYPVAAAAKLTEEQKAGKLPVGKLIEIQGIDDYSDAYDKLIIKAREAAQYEKN